MSSFASGLRSLNQEAMPVGIRRESPDRRGKGRTGEDVMQAVGSTLYCEPTAVSADLTSLLASAELGDREAADALFTALYEELHRMARRELAKRGAGVTLGATTLLHDAYLDISGREGAAFPDRNRFMAYAARVVRGLIIDN